VSVNDVSTSAIGLGAPSEAKVVAEKLPSVNGSSDATTVGMERKDSACHSYQT